MSIIGDRVLDSLTPLGLAYKSGTAVIIKHTVAFNAGVASLLSLPLFSAIATLSLKDVTAVIGIYGLAAIVAFIGAVVRWIWFPLPFRTGLLDLS